MQRDLPSEGTPSNLRDKKTSEPSAQAWGDFEFKPSIKPKFGVVIKRQSLGRKGVALSALRTGEKHGGSTDKQNPREPEVGGNYAQPEPVLSDRLEPGRV